MEIGAIMMNSSEAIKGLDGYSETLISLSVMLGAKMFEDKSSEHVHNCYEAMVVQLKEKQDRAKLLAFEIMKETHNVGSAGDLTGISAAVQRYVLADKQASEALIKLKEKDAPNEVSLAIDRFMKKAGLRPP